MVAFSSAYVTAVMELSAATGSSCTADRPYGPATAALVVRVVVVKVPLSAGWRPPKTRWRGLPHDRDRRGRLIPHMARAVSAAVKDQAGSGISARGLG